MQSGYPEDEPPFLVPVFETKYNHPRQASPSFLYYTIQQYWSIETEPERQLVWLAPVRYSIVPSTCIFYHRPPEANPTGVIRL